MNKEQFIKTSDGRIVCRRDEYLFHTVTLLQPENPFVQFAEIVIYTKTCPRGRSVRYKSQEECNKIAKEIAEQL